MRARRWGLGLIMSAAVALLGACDGAPTGSDDAASDADAGPPGVEHMCGDGMCSGPEDCAACPSDCGLCVAECGDGVCDASESCGSCTDDCGPCAAGRDFVGVLNPLNNYAMLKLDDETDGPERRFHFGTGNPGRGTSSVFAGDFDGDGRDTLGSYSAALGRFYLASSNEGGVEPDRLDFQPIAAPANRAACGGGGEGGEGGGASLVPIAGDFDGDGVDTVGVVDTSTATFYLRDAAGGVQTVAMSPACAFPIAGRFSADATTDGVGLFEPATGTFHLLVDLADPSSVLSFVFDAALGARPVVGDWDGDGVDTVGLYDQGAPRTAPNRFHLRNSNRAGPADRVIALDAARHRSLDDLVLTVPVAGDWDQAGDRGMGSGYPWDTTRASPHFDDTRHDAIDAAAEGLGHLYNLVVASHGQLVFEEYYRGQDASMGNNIKSVSKSVLSALYGIALEQGHFGYTGGNRMQHLETVYLDEQLGYVPGTAGSGYGELRGMSPTGSRRVTLYDMITMSAGFAWNENAAAQPNLGGMVGSGDWSRFVVTRAMVNLGRYTYSTGLTHLGSRILADATGMDTREYARTALFEPLGIADAATRWDFEPNLDAEGAEGPRNGGWQLWMRARDMARFGQLYVEGGTVDGAEILPADWIANPAEPDSPYYTTHAVFAAGGGCGATNSYGGWWRPLVQSASNGTFRGYVAIGFGGQLIIVYPEEELVIAMTSRIAGGSSCERIGPNFNLVRDQILPAVVRGGVGDP